MAAATRPDVPPGTLAYDFLLANPASLFYPPAAQPPSAGENVAISMRRLRGAIRAAKPRTARFRNRKAQALHTYLLLQAQFAKKH